MKTLSLRGIKINTKEIQKKLEVLKTAYSSGVLRVQYDDRFVVYRSLEEMERIIRSLEASLGIKKPGIQTIKIIASKGL